MSPTLERSSVMHPSSSLYLSLIFLTLSGTSAWPLSRLWARQGLTLAVCADPKAVPDSNCWGLANIDDYLNNPTTGWIHTTPTCEDSTKCCIPDDDGWSTCYLRLALPASGQDCTTLNDHPCTPQGTLDPNLAPSILAQVRYTVMGIYGVHSFFSQYFESKHLQREVVGLRLTWRPRFESSIRPSFVHHHRYHAPFGPR